MTPLEPDLELDLMPAADIDRYRRLDTDDVLADQLGRLFGHAELRQVWLLFLDQQLRLSDPIMPMDDHPLEPDEMFDTEDLGRVPFVRVMVERARMACDLVGAQEFMFMWERRGSAALDPADLRWARGLAEVSGAGGGVDAGAGVRVPPLRAQLLLHDDGVRVIDSAELR
ncbi:hypothetical protein PQI23_04495 [Leucobacter sp. USCH14]|uniref:hypothetical protein n=1 Tax=Leucobacter sp. USCH14 TaxID=3024838 RepID=UPI0030AC33C7